MADSKLYQFNFHMDDDYKDTLYSHYKIERLFDGTYNPEQEDISIAQLQSEMTEMEQNSPETYQQYQNQYNEYNRWNSQIESASRTLSSPRFDDLKQNYEGYARYEASYKLYQEWEKNNHNLEGLSERDKTFLQRMDQDDTLREFWQNQAQMEVLNKQAPQYQQMLEDNNFREFSEKQKIVDTLWNDGIDTYSQRKLSDETISIYQNNQEKFANNPELENNFKFAAVLNEGIKNSPEYAMREVDGVKENESSLVYGKDDVVRFRMKNLAGTGLNFTIEDGKSIVLAEDNKFTKQQLQELFSFLDRHNMGDVKFPESIKNIVVEDNENAQDQSTVGSFWDEMQEQALGADNNDNDPDYYDDPNDPELDENDPAWQDTVHAQETQTSKPMYASYNIMRNKIKARMKIMGFNNDKLLTTRRCADGSIVVCAYTTEDDKSDDGTNSKGKIKRTKAFAVKVKINNGIPELSWYLPQGKPLETKHAQCMLETIKATGAEYFSLPPVTDTAGAGQNAFWEACGKTLMVPICLSAEHLSPPKGDGTELGPDHIKAMIDIIDKEQKKDSQEVLDFKRKLLEQVEQQEAYKAEKVNKKVLAKYNAQEQEAKYSRAYQNDRADGMTYSSLSDYARSKYLEDNGGYKTNSELASHMKKLRGASTYKKMNDSFVDTLSNYINDRSENWDIVEVQAAIRAAAIIFKDFGDKGYNRYLDGNRPDLIMKIFQKTMYEQRDKVAKGMRESLENGGNISEAKKTVKQKTKEFVDTIKTGIDTDYGIKTNYNPLINASDRFNPDLYPAGKPNLRPIPGVPDLRRVPAPSRGNNRA